MILLAKHERPPLGVFLIIVSILVVILLALYFLSDWYYSRHG
jgi:hypothetical protein